jgi:hypothetical protein
MNIEDAPSLRQGEGTILGWVAHFNAHNHQDYFMATRCTAGYKQRCLYSTLASRITIQERW